VLPTTDRRYLAKIEDRRYDGSARQNRQGISI
jgi:hypothetical protein